MLQLPIGILCIDLSLPVALHINKLYLERMKLDFLIIIIDYYQHLNNKPNVSLYIERMKLDFLIIIIDYYQHLNNKANVSRNVIDSDILKQFMNQIAFGQRFKIHLVICIKTCVLLLTSTSDDLIYPQIIITLDPIHSGVLSSPSI